MKNTINPTAQIAELTARRAALRAEIDKMPDHKHSTPWHIERVDEIHAITRSIHAIEDAQIAEERRKLDTIQQRPVPLCGLAVRTLDTLCRRYRVQPESVLRSIVENFLSDACSDDTLAACVADEARLIKRTGAVPDCWWRNTELKSPGFEGDEQDGEEAA